MNVVDRAHKDWGVPVVFIGLLLAALGPLPSFVPLSAAAAAQDPRLAEIHSVAYAIGSGDLGSRYAQFGLIVVDGEEATAEQVATLRRNGAVVLAYLDVGTIEKGRSWYRRAKRYRLDFLGDWGEWYAATNKRGYRDLITSTVAPRILRKGFDGLFLDNTDMVETHPRQAAGMRRLVRHLAAHVHPDGQFLFAQNGSDSIGPLLPYYDGWNQEDVTWTYDFDRRRYVHRSLADVSRSKQAIGDIASQGLLVTAIDYTPTGDEQAVAEAVANACAAGALPFVSNIGLTRIPVQPYTCP